VSSYEGPTGLTPLARGPVGAAMVALAVVLTATSGRNGYARDELYFRMLRPAWGYLDQPPLAPWLVRTLATTVADTPWAVRIPATLAATASVLVVMLITRELGGGRGAQTLCAWAYAFASTPLLFGRVMLTATLDLVVWPAVVLLVMRALLRDQPAWWYAVGAVVGLSTYNKLLVALLLLALGAGLLLAGPRRVLWSPQLLGGVVLAVLVGAPNLLYQATHGWPQLAMGRALSAANGAEVRVLMWPFLALLLGPPLVPVWCAGWVALARRPAWRPVRFLAVSFPVLLVLCAVAGGQVYYPVGLLVVLFAAGCVPVADLLSRSPGWWRPAVVAAVIALPLLPVTVLGATPVPGLNQLAGDQVGWPTYVRGVAAVYDALPPSDRSRAVVVASNYGEAGALARYGPPLRLPAVYSGHNALYDAARPPETATVAVVVGGQLPSVRGVFASCTVMARMDNRLGVGNEEQGEPIAVCRHPVAAWATIWPRFQHRD
jgi:4-amino-4-deoxy-L-arabinose transferase-like glycosyltransferase